jgi:hypothetical protein
VAATAPVMHCLSSKRMCLVPEWVRLAQEPQHRVLGADLGIARGTGFVLRRLQTCRGDCRPLGDR